MKTLMTLLMMSLAALAQAGEQKIVETETGITVEYTGTPGAAANPAAAIVANDSALKINSLNAQIEQLRREAAEMSKLTGNETPEELALKKALAEEKSLQIEVLANEITQLSGNGQKQTAAAAQLKEEKPVRAPNYRAEKKQQIRELKMLRMTNPPPAGTP